MRAVLALVLLAGVPGLGAPGAPASGDPWAALARLVEADPGHEGTLAVVGPSGEAMRPIAARDALALLEAMVPAGAAAAAPAAGAGVGVEDPALRALLGYTRCSTFGFLVYRLADVPAITHAVAAPVDLAGPPSCPLTPWPAATRTWLRVEAADNPRVFTICTHAMVGTPADSGAWGTCGLDRATVAGDGTLTRLELFGIGFDLFFGQRGAVAGTLEP